MILRSGGENNYPEEIESVKTRMEYVLGYWVVQQKGRLVALIHLKMEEPEKKYQDFNAETVSIQNEK
jgi:long-chain acyl-CoA synthetase